MTTYAKDFSDELTTGVFASDFTSRFKSTSGWTIEAPTDAEDDRTFQSAGTDTASALGLVSWDDVDGDANRVNSDIVVRFKCASDAANEWWIWTRASGSASSENGYVCFLNTSNIVVMSRYDSGSQTVLTAASEDLNPDDPGSPWAYFTGDADPAFSRQPADLWLYVRFRVNGTGATVTLQTKVWIDGVNGLDNEPDYWIMETTDTSGSRITTAGWCGIGRFGETGQVDWDYIAIGTNGDTAPINASTNTTVRVSTVVLEVMAQKADPTVQMSQQFVNVLGQDSAPEVRLSSMYAQVLHERNVDEGNDVSGQLIITSG